jgi:enoyl-CoA hydratase/carnithine racemase
MTRSTIIAENIPEKNIGIITLNRPEVRNAINQCMPEELLEVFGSWDADSRVRAVILTGGNKIFAAGADIAAMVKKTVGRLGTSRRESMDVSAAIKGRRSVRSYKDLEVKSDKIEKILEAGRLSPSANNR